MRTELKQEIEQRLDVINAQMSTYLPDSDLMRFNRTLSTDWQQLPPPVVGLVEQAKRISQLTGGRYDISVGPLVNLWGFGNSGDRNTPPSQQEIDEVMKRVGYRQLDSRTTPPALRKSIAGLQIDLSSIAKGWAVDEIAALLRAKGIMNFLVEIGGELRAQGEKTPGRPWRIAIERPSYDTRSVQRVIALNDIAMATSGDYRNFFTDGKRMYSHTIDPATGQPVEHRLASVTVLAENCAAADAWATALLALGDQQAPDLADSQNLKALFIIRSAEGLVEKTSRALSESGVLSNGGS
jgi:thiamine biosynthesis lipoprotein